MAFKNLDKKHLSNAQNLLINNNLDNIENIIANLSTNLEATESQKVGRVNEKNKLLVDKVRMFHNNQPEIQSPEVDWDEFENDYQDRKRVAVMLQKIKFIEMQLLTFKNIHDYDNYNDALIDYNYTKYKSNSTSTPEYLNKIDELKIFFPNTGKTKKAKD